MMTELRLIVMAASRNFNLYIYIYAWCWYACASCISYDRHVYPQAGALLASHFLPEDVTLNLKKMTSPS